MRKNRKHKKSGVPVIIVIALVIILVLAACRGLGSDKSAPETSDTELAENSGSDEVSEDRQSSEEAALASHVEDESGDEASESVSDQESANVTETYPGTVAAEGVKEEKQSYFGIMHATISGVQEENGVSVYTFFDNSDPEDIWAISGVELGDVLIDAVPGTKTAVLFNGNIIGDSENVDFIVMLPEGDYEIRRAEGVTVDNMMSSFTISCDDGTLLSFLKDNCSIEDNALSGNNGDRVVVYYAYSASDGSCYPFKIYSNE